MRNKMKKGTVLMAAGMILAAMPMTASADTQLEKLATLQDVDWVDGTDLLRIEGDAGYCLGTTDGEKLTEEIYSRSMEYRKGNIIAWKMGEEINSCGLLSLEGKELIPMQYGDVDVLTKNWALGIVLEEATADQYDYTSWFSNDSFYKIKTVDVYYISDGSASCLTSLSREQYLDADAQGEYITIQDRSTNKVTCYDSTFQEVATDLNSTYDFPESVQEVSTYYENGQYGLKDAEGNVIMEPAFSTIYSFYRDHASVSTGEKEGLIDKEGNVIIPAEYDDILTSYYLPSDETGDSGYEAYGYFAVVKDGKLGYADETGTITCAPKYAKDVVENNGASAFLTDMEGNQILMAADGVETVVEGYDSVRAMYYGAGMYYEVNDADYNYGLIDWHGNELLPCEYSDVALSGDGQYLLVESKENYGSSDLYRVTFTPSESASAAASQEAEGQEDAADVSDADAEENASQEPAGENGASGEMAAAGTLIDTAITMLETDNDVNRTSAIELLKNAIELLGDTNASAVTVLNSAVTLLQTSGSDIASITTLLSSAKGLL